MANRHFGVLLATTTILILLSQVVAKQPAETAKATADSRPLMFKKGDAAHQTISGFEITHVSGWYQLKPDGKYPSFLMTRVQTGNGWGIYLPASAGDRIGEDRRYFSAALSLKIGPNSTLTIEPTDVEDFQIQIFKH